MRRRCVRAILIVGCLILASCGLRSRAGLNADLISIGRRIGVRESRNS